MHLKFPFVYAKVERFGRLFYPVIQLEIKTIFGWKKFDFLVDTGADATTLPSTILPYLGIKTNKLTKSRTHGVGGISIDTFDAVVPLKIGEAILKVNVSITTDNNTPFLLGRKDIFEERFSLLIDSKNKVTVLEENGL